MSKGGSGGRGRARGLEGWGVGGREGRIEAGAGGQRETRAREREREKRERFVLEGPCERKDCRCCRGCILLVLGICLVLCWKKSRVQEWLRKMDPVTSISVFSVQIFSFFEFFCIIGPMSLVISQVRSGIPVRRRLSYRSELIVTDGLSRSDFYCIV